MNIQPMVLLTKFAKWIGWWLLGLSTFWSLFCLVVVIGNGMEFDCDLSGVASMGAMMALPSLLGATLVFVANRRLGKSAKLLTVILGLAIFFQVNTGLIIHFYDTEETCIDLTNERIGPEKFEKLNELFRPK